MPFNLGRKNATKKGFKQKNYLKEYLGAEAFWLSRKTERGDCYEQSREKEKSKENMINPHGRLQRRGAIDHKKDQQICQEQCESPLRGFSRNRVSDDSILEKTEILSTQKPEIKSRKRVKKIT